MCGVLENKLQLLFFHKFGGAYIQLGRSIHERSVVQISQSPGSLPNWPWCPLGDGVSQFSSVSKETPYH